MTNPKPNETTAITMALDSDDTIWIEKEAALGQPLSIDSDEVRVFRAKVDAEISEARVNGLVCDITSEIPGDCSATTRHLQENTMESPNTNPDAETSQETPLGPPEKTPKQTTRDELLAHLKALGFRKASSPNGGGCVITGFPQQDKHSPEPPPKF